jgi:ubiquinol-cytochrome c reductase cytochrome b subunit
VYVAKAGGFFFVVFAVIALMAATMTINPVWNYGPFDPGVVSAGAQPDWYMLFLEGGLRLMPGWEFVIGQYTVSMNILIPGVVIPGLLFTVLALWPFIEAFATGDKREHHVLDRPRNAPFRTAFGVAYLTAFLILVLAGSNDLIATHFHLSINDITWTFRVLFFVAPVLAFWITKRICFALQRKDRELVLHGHETGRIVRFASGEYIEVHKPLDAHERWLRVQHEPRRPVEIEPAEDSRGVRRKGYRIDAARRRLSKVFYEDRVEPVTPAELAAAQSHGGHDALPLATEERHEELTAGASGSRHLAPEPEDTEGTQGTQRH